MDTSITNPYQTPAAEVLEADATGLEGILPRFSAWAVFGLSVITLSIYSYYWMYNRTQALNREVPNPVSQPFMWATLLLMICSWVSNLVVQVSPAIGGLMGMAGLVGSVMFIVWIFKLRNRLHQLQGLVKGDRLWAGPVLTFFFNVIYLQYKINQSIDSKRGQG